ncbi:MAG: TaqI-like C-terminal specificity domain-containing protein [Thermodesulfobacteriota bacterium]
MTSNAPCGSTGFFTYDEDARYSNDKSYILPTDDLALLGILNSQVTNFLLRQISPPVRGGFMEMRVIFMEQLPIPSATATQKAPVIERVRNILADPDSPAVPNLEVEINNLVYNLYGLMDEEIVLIEEKSGWHGGKAMNNSGKTLWTS